MVAERNFRKPKIDAKDLPTILTPTEYMIANALAVQDNAARARYAEHYSRLAGGRFAHIVERYQTFTPISPRNVHVSVPLTNFATSFALDPSRFAVEILAPTVISDKMNAKFWRFDSPESFRIEDIDEDNYAPGRGGGRPKELDMEIAVDTFDAQQRALSKSIGEATQMNADFDAKNRIARHLTINLQLRKLYRAMAILTDASVMNSSPSATSIGGVTEPWGGNASLRPIRTSSNYAAQQIQQNTFNSVDGSTLYIVMNPNTARLITESAEFADHVKQSVAGERFLIGEAPYSNGFDFGLPRRLFGFNTLIVNAVQQTGKKNVSTPPGGSSSYIWPDNAVAYINSEGPSLDSLSTLSAFTFEPFNTEDHHIPSEHINNVQVLNSYDIKLSAQSSGYLIEDVTT